METKTLTAEELDQIKELVTEIDNVMYELGRLNYEKFEIDNTIIATKEKLISLKNQEKLLSKTLSDKYGEGLINPENGEITQP
jgi:hypothetical protein